MAGEELKARGAALQEVLQPAAAGQQIPDRPGRRHAEQDGGVGEPHVAVDQHGTVARLREGDGEVDADIGLARASLAGGDRDDAGTGRKRDHATTSD
jgi:hypothetical protein